MNLQHYLTRIDYTGPQTPTMQTLTDVHHQHLLHIPYENGDVQLGTPLDFDLQRIFDKLIVKQRGGWCYEMNGLLGWALKEMGFAVTRMSGAVMRASEGDEQLGNHLILEVLVEGQAYLADVGLGDGLRFPIPLAPGTYEQRGLSYALEQLDDGFLRFHNHVHSNVSSFDFRHAPANETELADKCLWLQRDPRSPFKTLLIVNRFSEQSIEVQLGKIRTSITPDGKTNRELQTLAQVHTELKQTFGLDLDLSPIWSNIEAAHEKYFSDSA